MRETSEIYIPIPKARNTKVKVEVDGNDLTPIVREGIWIKQGTSGIGTFQMNLSNAFGQLTGLYSAGDVVKLYADNTDATTLQFWGRIDFVKDNISSDGQFLEIEGRHRAYLLTEYLVCYSATDTEPSVILKAIIDALPASYGITYANVEATTKTMDVEWVYKPFWDCVVELCRYSGFDAYIDDDLDFHFFEENSILNSEEAIVEGDNFIKTSDWGTDDYYEKTRVTAIGQDGYPIVYTAISPAEGDEIKEIMIKDSSANTEEKVQYIAEAKLEELTNRAPQAKILSHGLETLKPGENLWIIIPRQKIAGQYKAIQITHKFGTEIGGWRTETAIEEEEGGIASTIQRVSQKSDLNIQAENINKLNYSFNVNFEDENKTGSHTSTKIDKGKLLLIDDSVTTGSWISTGKTAIETVTSVEMRVNGTNLSASKFYFSLNDGVSWEQVTTFSELKTPSGSGKNLKIKVELIKSAGSTLNPELDSLVLLYS